jgi:hypothetical protein
MVTRLMLPSGLRSGPLLEADRGAREGQHQSGPRRVVEHPKQPWRQDAIHPILSGLTCEPSCIS